MTQGCYWRMMVEWSEWYWNEGNFWWWKFWSPSSLVHPRHFESLWNVYFVILWSFKYQMTSEWRRWCWNDNFLTLGWWIMTWMRVEWGNFWSKVNALVFSFHHFVLILPLFYHSIAIQVIIESFCHSHIICHHSNIIPWALHAPAPKSRHFSCNQPLG